MANRKKVIVTDALLTRVDTALRGGISMTKIAKNEGVQRQTLEGALNLSGIVLVESPRTWALAKQSDGSLLFGSSAKPVPPVQEAAAA